MLRALTQSTIIRPSLDHQCLLPKGRGDAVHMAFVSLVIFLRR
jgi:hypothetical protein